MKRMTWMLGVLAVLGAVVPVAGQPQPPRPTDRPTDPNLIAFSTRAERRMLAALHEETPLIEAYFQRHVLAGKLGYQVQSDAYYFGRFDWRTMPTMEALLDRDPAVNADRSSATPDQDLLDGLAQLMVPDWNELGRDRYEYRFVGRTVLGPTRCLLYAVTPINKEAGGFTGQLSIEDTSYNIVRFKGINTRVDRALAALRHETSTFHLDAWRVHAKNGRWLPAFTYVEEAPPFESPDAPIMKGQVRFWSYKNAATSVKQQYTTGELEESADTVGGGPTSWPAPIISQRLFEQEAEANVVNRLVESGFLGTPGAVEKMLEQVVTNLLLSNKVAVAAPIRVRVLLTTPMETLTVGNTIVISRGLLDVLPSEPAIALVLAHQVAHNVLGHRKIESKLAFPEVLWIPDRELLARVRFRHSPSEEGAANGKAIELLEQSPYKAAMADGGVFLEVIAARAPQLRNLIKPHLGEYVADVEQTVERHEIFGLTPIYEPEFAEQIAALALGSRLVVDPRTDRVELLEPQPIPAQALRERGELRLAPFMAFLKDSPDALDRQIAAQPGSKTKRSQKGGKPTPASTRPTLTSAKPAPKAAGLKPTANAPRTEAQRVPAVVRTRADANRERSAASSGGSTK